MYQDQRAQDEDHLAVAVHEEFSAVLSVPMQEIGRETDFYDLGGDSLQKLELIARLEERFAVKLADGEIADLGTVTDHARLLAAKLGP